MFPTKEIIVPHLKTLRRGMKNSDVLFLHALLNHHLGPPDDQLPLQGAGALDFGARTEAKVKRFQKANKVDFGTRNYGDGVVGSHTWTALNETQQITLAIAAAPSLKLTLPTLPSFPGSAPPVAPVAIPVPKLKLDNMQLQAGEQGTIPFASTLRGDKKGVTLAHSLQLVAVVLKKKDGFHNEGQIGPVINFNRGPGADSKIDLGLTAVFNQANMPGSSGRFSWSIQEQAALVKSLTKRTLPSPQLSGIVGVNLSIIKNKGGDDVLQVTTQAGILLEADPPTEESNQKWTVKASGTLFFGLTGTLNGL